MPSTYGFGDRPVEDLTARARIVDAALAQFAERGSARATMRSIADGAGVSVGLVQHHFGTKDGLRRACDERVLTLVRTKVANYGSGGGLTDPDFLGVLYELAAPVMPYVARAALEEDERSASLFDEAAALTAEWLTSQWPDRFPAGGDRTRAAAAVMMAMQMGTLVLNHQIVRQLGLDDDDNNNNTIPSPEVGVATLDVYQAMGELLASPYGRELRGAVDTYVERRQGDRTTEGSTR